MVHLTVFLRTVLIYATVFTVLRIMGKREIGKLSLFDLVISIMIAEIAVLVLEDINRPMLDGLLPMFTLFAIQMTLAYAGLKSQKLRAWIDGKPSVLIQKGQLNRDEMARQRYNLNDLLLQLRENKIVNVADVELAILEQSGKLTALTKEQISSGWDTAAEAADLGEHTGAPRHFRYEGLPLPLIMDGKVQDENLEKLGKTRFWLKNEIQAKGVREFKNVFFCSIDHRGKVFLDKKR